MTQLRIRWARVATWLIAVLLMTSVLSAPAVPQAKAAVYPSGKANWAVTLAGLPPAGATSAASPPFVRLAMYYFQGDGRLYEGFWYWSWASATPKVNTGLTASGCDGCAVHTAAGFESGNGTYPKTLWGSYTINSDSTVSITWDNGSTEKWRASTTANAGLAAIDLVSSSYGATNGKGFGSNARATYSVPLANVSKHLYKGRNDGWQVVAGKGTRASLASSLDLTNFVSCNANCLSATLSSTACSACPDGSPSPIRYYLASEGGRKNYYEHFCTCLTSGTCYNGNSHVKPQLQVISDDGVLHGWVGVEVSHYDTISGYMGTHWHVDV